MILRRKGVFFPHFYLKQTEDRDEASLWAVKAAAAFYYTVFAKSAEVLNAHFPAKTATKELFLTRELGLPFPPALRWPMFAGPSALAAPAA